jgi:hypothetical protein
MYRQLSIQAQKVAGYRLTTYQEIKEKERKHLHTPCHVNQSSQSNLEEMIQMMTMEMVTTMEIHQIHQVHPDHHHHHPDLLSVPVLSGKERGIKPEPVTKIKQFEMFCLNYVIYLMQNETVYPTDQDKILFILSLMKDGVPGKWMKHWMAQLLAGQ